jgi:hypothetical protein
MLQHICKSAYTAEQQPAQQLFTVMWKNYFETELPHFQGIIDEFPEKPSKKK